MADLGFLAMECKHSLAQNIYFIKKNTGSAMKSNIEKLIEQAKLFWQTAFSNSDLFFCMYITS